MSPKLRRILSYWQKGLQFRKSDESYTEAEARKLLHTVKRAADQDVLGIIFYILLALVIAAIFLR